MFEHLTKWPRIFMIPLHLKSSVYILITIQMGNSLTSSMISPAVSANHRSLTTNEAQQQEQVAQGSGLNLANRNPPIVLFPRYRMLPTSISRILLTRISILSPIATQGQLMRSTTILEGQYSTTFVMMKRASSSATRSYLHKS